MKVSRHIGKTYKERGIDWLEQTDQLTSEIRDVVEPDLLTTYLCTLVL